MLHANAEQALPDIDAALDELTQATQPDALAAAACPPSYASDRFVCCWISPPVMIGRRPPSLRFGPWPLHRIRLRSCSSIGSCGFPMCRWKDPGAPTPAGLPLLTPALRAARRAGRTLRTAADLWLAQQDYRFFDRLVTALADDAAASGLRQHYEEASGGSPRTYAPPSPPPAVRSSKPCWMKRLMMNNGLVMGRFCVARCGRSQELQGETR